LSSTLELVKQELKTLKTIYVVCRRGNDSQIAVDILMKSFESLTIKDLIGGLAYWSNHIDKNFPIY